MKEILICVLLTLSFQVSADFEQDMQRQMTDSKIKMLEDELRNRDERIKRLEAILGGNQVNSEQRVIVSGLAWQNPANWRKIRVGMSSSQVESIVGKPSKVETDVIGWVTLFYQGEVQGAGYVSGNVRLSNKNRVAQISQPVM